MLLNKSRSEPANPLATHLTPASCDHAHHYPFFRFQFVGPRRGLLFFCQFSGKRRINKRKRLIWLRFRRYCKREFNLIKSFSGTNRINRLEWDLIAGWDGKKLMKVVLVCINGAEQKTGGQILQTECRKKLTVINLTVLKASEIAFI